MRCFVLSRVRVTDPQNAGAGAREAVHSGAGEKAPVDGGRGTAQIAAQRQSSLWRTQRTDPQAYAESWHRRSKNQRGKKGDTVYFYVLSN